MRRPLYIGLMSGTSVDSLDAALVDFSNEQGTIVDTHSIVLDTEIRDIVHRLAISGNDEIATMARLDQSIAQLSCQLVSELYEKAHIEPKELIAIGSHGQTIRHIPKSTNNSGYSLQVGDPNIIAEGTGITTIADFRRRDIAAGGHGAPLAPAYHRAAFGSETHDRVILNTGGIANITYLPTGNTKEVIGYDTGPANGLMDSWAQRHIHQAYDRDGQWAKSGTIHPELLEALLKHPFFTMAYPKSTGREDFNMSWLDKQLAAYSQLRPEDVQATLLALSVESISQEISKLGTQGNIEVYVCGGGAYNKAFMAGLEDRLRPHKLDSTAALGIAPEWVEAVAFAWLAKQTINHLQGNLPSVTGADEGVVLGGVYWGAV